MEVDRISFAPRLLEILEDMAKCSFVAVDFEFSGIATRAAHAAGRQTLQERYHDTKEAAGRYQILQMGLTFAIYDNERQCYTLKPYNMNLNPLMDEKLDVERIFSFQSGAVEFLLGHRFNIDRTFRSGVPYLSRDEAKKARKLAHNRLSRKNIEDIRIGKQDLESLAFLKDLRKVIDTWKEKNYAELELTSRHEIGVLSAEIANGTLKSFSVDSPGPSSGLNRFERRLVHQLVRAEYQDLVSIGGSDSVRIIHLDEEREAEILRQRKQKLEEQITRQTGCRWIIEALLGNPLHRIDVRSFAFDPHTGSPKCVDLRVLQSRFDQACASIKLNRMPLVGHNLFTDLTYMYRTFLGELPGTLELFADDIHRSFPKIIDTKYLATHNCGDINPASSLQEIELELQTQETPKVELHKQHAKYANQEAFHEAGYDSYLTALVAIRLASKLENDGGHVKEAKKAKEDKSITKSEPRPTGGLTGVFKSIVGGGMSVLAPSSHVTPAATSKPSRQTQQNQPKTPAAGRFSTANMYERLGAMSVNDNTSSNDEGALDGAAQSQESLPPMTAMPPFASDFWKVYGNKLRVFGTVEGLLDLTSGE